MGLDIAVDEFSFRAGSYSGFNAFRERLAAHALGVPLTATWEEGFTVEDADMDGLLFLLNHSDCDGDIPPGQAKKLQLALERYKNKCAGEKVFDDPESNSYYWSLVDSWIKACQISVATRKRIEFC